MGKDIQPISSQRKGCTVTRKTTVTTVIELPFSPEEFMQMEDPEKEFSIFAYGIDKTTKQSMDITNEYSATATHFKA